MATDPLNRYFAVFRCRKPHLLGALIPLRSLLGLCCLGCGSLIAQTETPTNKNSAPEAAAPQATASEPPRAEVVLTEGESEALVAQLGAATFAERERAVSEILRVGSPMIPLLRNAIKNGGDAELVLRAKATLGQLTSGSFESKVAVFLTGQGDGIEFDGWQTVAAILGDSLASRDMFIQILRAHPGLVAALDGTTRDRQIALNEASQRIQMNMFQNKFPTAADCIALLLPLNDPGVPLSNGYEKTLMSVLHTQMAGMSRDAFLWKPVSELLNRWVVRSRTEPRSDVLWNAMQWDLSGARELGLRTLRESTDVPTLQTAMQAVARFGTIQDAKQIALLIDDERIAMSPDGTSSSDTALQIPIGDTAIATIAVLYKVPLKDLGMNQAELHPKLGFLIDNAGFLSNQQDDRTRAAQTVRGWISGEAPPNKPRF